MLYYNTIHTTTLELLKKLQQHERLSNLRLVGGTSLALQLGHRSSIDIDLFGKTDIEIRDLPNLLALFGDVKPIVVSKAIFTCTINQIKVDIVNYKYPWIAELLEVDDLHLAHTKDIAAMKLSAITGRGSKKDFIDLYFLLQEYSLDMMLDFYDEKYNDGSRILVLKSLTYFVDADDDLMPKMHDEISWKKVKATIKDVVKDYSQNL